jgi:mannose-6-phosphate isomerase-like protein (cupin superfamily)
MCDQTECRPWGYYEVLSDGLDHKVKRITVHPGKRLSLQRHRCRAEHWFILHGEALVTLGTKELFVKSGDSVNIQEREVHRIANRGTDSLIFIEIQTGTYFGEDDIERTEDDYGRV